MNTTDLRTLAEEFTQRTLLNVPPNSMCFSVCYPLSLYLTLNGFNNRIDGGNYTRPNKKTIGHFWLVLKDGSEDLVDPTIQQFSLHKKLPFHIGKIQKRIASDDRYSFDGSYKKWISSLLCNGYLYPEMIKYDLEYKKYRIPLKKYISVNLRAAEIILTESLSKAIPEKSLYSYETYFNSIAQIIARYPGKYEISSILYPNLFHYLINSENHSI